MKYFRDDSSFWLQLLALSKKGIIIKILMDGYNSQIIRQIYRINSSGKEKKVKIGYSNKLGIIDELLIICD
jgi:hypothetical protein